MAKKKEKKDKVEKDLDNANNSINALLNQYNILSDKEKKSLLKEFKKTKKRYVKEYIKNPVAESRLNLKFIEYKIKAIENIGEKIYLNYGIVDFHHNAKRFKSIKDKEGWLDYLFSKRMKTIINKTPAPKTENEAKILEGLITQYDRKIRETKYYDKELVFNSINKLTNYRNKLNSYEYSKFIQSKIDGKEDEEPIYKATQKPLLVDGHLVGIQFNFF